MPPIALIIPLAAIVALTYIIKLSIEHARWKAVHASEPERLPADTSMKMSELEQLLEASVARALKPIDARLDALERGLPAAPEEPEHATEVRDA